MNRILTLLAIVFNFNVALAQFVPPVMGPDNIAVYCTEDYHATVDSMYYSIAPGETKELKIDIKNICTAYILNDISLQTGVSFQGDPRWLKGKDQIVAQGFSFEVIDVATGQNLVDLAKSVGAPACNWGSGFVFSDLTKLPASLRPVLLRLKNNGRDTKSAAFTLHYANQVAPSICGDYPRR